MKHDVTVYRTASHRSTDRNGHAVLGSPVRSDDSISHHGVVASGLTVKEVNQMFKSLKGKQNA